MIIMELEIGVCTLMVLEVNMEWLDEGYVGEHVGSIFMQVYYFQ